VVAALSLMLPVGQNGSHADFAEQAKAVVETANAVSKKLGYTS